MRVREQGGRGCYRHLGPGGPRVNFPEIWRAITPVGRGLSGLKTTACVTDSRDILKKQSTLFSSAGERGDARGETGTLRERLFEAKLLTDRRNKKSGPAISIAGLRPGPIYRPRKAGTAAADGPFARSVHKSSILHRQALGFKSRPQHLKVGGAILNSLPKVG